MSCNWATVRGRIQSSSPWFSVIVQCELTIATISQPSYQAAPADCALCRSKRVESVCLPCGHIPFCSAWYAMPFRPLLADFISLLCLTLRSSGRVMIGSGCPVCGKQIRQLHHINFQYALTSFLLVPHVARSGSLLPLLLISLLSLARTVVPPQRNRVRSSRGTKQQYQQHHKEPAAQPTISLFHLSSSVCV
jgi:hypothetical protein